MPKLQGYHGNKIFFDLEIWTTRARIAMWGEYLIGMRWKVEEISDYCFHVISRMYLNTPTVYDVVSSWASTLNRRPLPSLHRLHYGRDKKKYFFPTSAFAKIGQEVFFILYFITLLLFWKKWEFAVFAEHINLWTWGNSQETGNTFWGGGLG